MGILSKWALKITNGKDLYNKITTNQTIMDLILEYIKEMKDRNKILNKINQVRLHKKAYLPFKLLGMKGQQKTKYFECIEEKSQYQWKFKFPLVLIPAGRVKKVWKEFLS